MKMHRKTSSQQPTYLTDIPTGRSLGFDRDKALLRNVVLTQTMERMVKFTGAEKSFP